MATVRTSFMLTNGMIGPLKSIITATNAVVSSFRAAESAASSGFDTAALNAAQRELASASAQFTIIEEEIAAAVKQQERFNKKLGDASPAASQLLSKMQSVAAAAAASAAVQNIIGITDKMTLNNARLDLLVDDGGSVNALERKIYASAQRSRGNYLDVANVVSKLGITAGHAFGNTDELIAFTELMNKNFRIGGASGEERSAGMYQLTQAMASGRLQGDEFRSIMENAPLLAQAIADFTSKSIGELREMSSQGLITADIIKGAMFASADQINARYAAMPMTIGEVGTAAGNALLVAFQPVLQGIGSGARYIYDNWSALAPIFYGLAAGMLVYAAAIAVQAVAARIGEAANKGLIATMLANPILWVAVAIGVIIALIYKWVQSVGGAKVAWLIFTDKVITAAEWMSIGFSRAMNAIAEYAGQARVRVLTEMQNMVNGVIDRINRLIGLLNHLPGVNIEAIAQVTFGADAAAKAETARQQRTNDLYTKLSGIDAARAERQQNISNARAEARTTNTASQLDLGGLGYGGADLGAIAADSARTADNTSAMAQSMDILDEDLKYMRDIADREAINRFTTAEIKLEMTNTFGDIRETADVDGILSSIELRLAEMLASGAEGVHV